MKQRFKGFGETVTFSLYGLFLTLLAWSVAIGADSFPGPRTLLNFFGSSPIDFMPITDSLLAFDAIALFLFSNDH